MLVVVVVVVVDIVQLVLRPLATRAGAHWEDELEGCRQHPTV